LEEIDAGAAAGIGAEGATAPETLRQKDHDAVDLESDTMACSPKE
jgi:hypothetical protein